MIEQRRYRVWHPNHGETEVVASDPYWALLAAAKEWGLRWRTIAKDCVITQLGRVPAKEKENANGDADKTR